MRLKFPKSENLKRRKLIEQLFSEGKSIAVFPIRLRYLATENKECSQAAFSVPKRNFKLAVSRNQIKRKMREAYRLNKSVLNINKETHFALLFLYLGKDSLNYKAIDKAMATLLKKLQQ